MQPQPLHGRIYHPSRGTPLQPKCSGAIGEPLSRLRGRGSAVARLAQPPTHTLSGLRLISKAGDHVQMSMGNLLACRGVAVPAHVVPVRSAAKLQVALGQPKELCGRKPLVIGEIESGRPVGFRENDAGPGQLLRCGAMRCVKAPLVLKEDLGRPEIVQAAEVAPALAAIAGHVSIIATGQPSGPAAGLRRRGHRARRPHTPWTAARVARCRRLRLSRRQAEPW